MRFCYRNSVPFRTNLGNRLPSELSTLNRIRFKSVRCVTQPEFAIGDCSIRGHCFAEQHLCSISGKPYIYFSAIPLNKDKFSTHFCVNIAAKTVSNTTKNKKKTKKCHTYCRSSSRITMFKWCKIDSLLFNQFFGIFWNYKRFSLMSWIWVASSVVNRHKCNEVNPKSYF